MTDTVSLSFRVSTDKARDVERLSATMDRPKSWVLEKALDAYLETQAWQVAHIEEGLAELRQGGSVPHEDVAAWLAGWGTDGEGEAPR